MEKIKLSELTEKDAENLMDNSKVWTKVTGEIDEQQEQLEDDMNNLASDYANILLKNMVAEYDVIYNKDYVKDFMLDNLTNIYPEGAYYNRKDNKIYYLTQD